MADAPDRAGPVEPLLEFLAVRRRLRAECSWNRAQTHRSLARYLIEEIHETLEAIDVGEETGDWSHLREELGDLLLQVYAHAVIAEETGAFTIDDVARDATAKMVRRNPLVFGTGGDAGTDGRADGVDGVDRVDGVDADDPAAVHEAWEAAKAEEKQRTSVTEGLPPGLPALLLADKVLDRLERAGTPATYDSDDLGDRLLALVAEARAAGTDPEQALRDAVRRVVRTAERS